MRFTQTLLVVMAACLALAAAATGAGLGHWDLQADFQTNHVPSTGIGPEGAWSYGQSAWDLDNPLKAISFTPFKFYRPGSFGWNDGNSPTYAVSEAADSSPCIVSVPVLINDAYVAIHTPTVVRWTANRAMTVNIGGWYQADGTSLRNKMVLRKNNEAPLLSRDIADKMDGRLQWKFTNVSVKPGDVIDYYGIYQRPAAWGSLVNIGMTVDEVTESEGNPAPISKAAATPSATGKQPKRTEMRYASGGTEYVEDLIDGRLVGRYWSCNGSVDPSAFWKDDAFEIRVKDDPAGPETLLDSGWQWVDKVKLKTQKKTQTHYAVSLSNKTYPIMVRVHTLLDGTPVIARWLEITNTGTKPVALTGISPWCGRLWSKDAPITLGHSSRWEIGWEGWFGWTQLQPGMNEFRNDRGLSGDDPYFIARNESNGEYFCGQLAWPVNYRMQFEKQNGLAFKIGPTAKNALRVIEPGETITTPAVHLGYVKQDFDACVQAMVDHVRRSVVPTHKPERAYLPQYLIPEDWPMTVYRSDDFNETNMKKCIDVAAAAGIEVFILDGPMWCSAYGNWLVANQKKFPNGIAPLADYAHKKGMLFGLYLETEGGRDSYSVAGGASIGPWSSNQFFREHRNWFVAPRNTLNLSIPGASEYLESEISQIVETHKLDLYRHDFNAPMVGQGTQTLRDGFVEADYWRCYDNFYGVFDRLGEKYPDLLLQQASGGGTRLDLATVGCFYEHFPSDRVTMPWVYRRISGLSVYMPLETVVSTNGMGARQDLPDAVTTVRGAYALGTTPVLFNAVLPKSLEEFTPEFRETCLRYADLYKSFMRPVLPTCKVFHLDPVNATGGVDSSDWFAMEFTSPDRSKGWAMVIRLSDKAGSEYLFKPKGLDAAKDYKVTFDNTRSTQVISGASLMRDGLKLAIPADPCSELLLFQKD